MRPPVTAGAMREDPMIPVDALLGGGAHSIVRTATDAAGGEVRSVTPRQVSYQPGSSLTVRYDATVRWPDGRVAHEMLVATAGGALPRGALVLDDGEHQVAVWRVPHDPRLPGLVAAMDPERVIRLLADLGAPVASAEPRLRAYRPGRRAVVEVCAPGARLFLKVVRPRAVEALQRRHELLAGRVPVPRSLGWSPELGLIALQAVGGITLRSAIHESAKLPSSAGLLELLDALPAPGAIEGSPPDWQSARFANLIGTVAPELAARVDAIAEQLSEHEALGSDAAVAIHGDFHEAQLLVDGGRITGLLDVDTFGGGQRVDDLATLIGHLATLAIGSPRRVGIEGYAARLLGGFDRTVDPKHLRLAVAAVVLGLATGPFRVLEPRWRTATARRVHLAEQWLTSAGRVATTPLTTR